MNALTVMPPCILALAVISRTNTSAYPLPGYLEGTGNIRECEREGRLGKKPNPTVVWK